MNYRTLGRTGMQASEVGLGCEHLQGLPYSQVKEVVDAALECGINIFDVFMSEPQVRLNLGRALKGRREQVLIQGHIGAAWINGQYERTRDLALCERFFFDLLERLGTDYIDIGMLHFVDTAEDFERVFAPGGLMDYAQQLKAKGVIRAIGMSSHDPQSATRAVETGWLDVLMFSLNPAYDLLPEDTLIDDLFVPASYQKEGLCGINPVREELYRTCERHGTAITVMKGMAAGSLLSAEMSPFGVALTPVQCIHYALTRPAVCSVLAGAKTAQEVKSSAAYETAGERERDYSLILSSTPKYSMKGRCMYCNHCLPCPSHIDIAQVQKYLDLAQSAKEVPDTVRAHYGALERHAQDCIACGSCEGNCPFSVPVIERMEQAKEIFGF